LALEELSASKDRFKLLYDWILRINADNSLAKNPNLTPEQIDLLYETEGVNKTFLAANPKLTNEQFTRFLNYPTLIKTQKLQKSLALNPHLTTEQIDILYKTKGVNKGLLAKFPKLNTEQFMRIFNDEDFNKNYLAKNPHLTEEQIDLLYGHDHVSINDLAENPKLTDDQFMRFFNLNSVNLSLAQNPNLTTEQIDLLYDRGVNKGLLSAYSKLTDEQFMRFFNDKDFDKDYLAQNDHLTTEQIDLLYNTLEDVGKNHLAQYPKLTDKQFMRAFNDGNKKSLAQNPSINHPANKPFASGVFNWRW